MKFSIDWQCSTIICGQRKLYHTWKTINTISSQRIYRMACVRNEQQQYQPVELLPAVSTSISYNARYAGGAQAYDNNFIQQRKTYGTADTGLGAPSIELR